MKQSLSVDPFKLRPHDALGTWESRDRRFRKDAHELLSELENLCSLIKESWPKEIGLVITGRDDYPELWELAKHRDRTSDMVRIYSAMAVEGFLNFYGVLRTGESTFNEHFERLGLVPKLRMLLLVCDKIDLPKTDSLVLALDQLA